MNTTLALDLTAEIIDVRQLMEVFETLEASGDDPEIAHTLELILADLCGNGGDERWRGEWYPVTLIADHYFTDYAREMLEDCDVIPSDLPSWVEIDWEATARNVRIDYTCTEIDGSTYWYR